MSEILKKEFGERFHEYRRENGSHLLNYPKDIDCLEIHGGLLDFDYYKDIESICNLYESVSYVTLLRHPISRFLSGLRHTRRSGGYDRFPYGRMILGPYEDFTYTSMVDIDKQEIRKRYCTPSIDSIMRFCLAAEAPLFGSEFTIGQAIEGSLPKSVDDLIKISNLNNEVAKQVKNLGNPTNLDERFITHIGFEKYKVIGTTERMNSFLKTLHVEGILSKNTLDYALSHERVNAGVKDIGKDLVDPEIAFNFYAKYPLDFCLWDFAFSQT